MGCVLVNFGVHQGGWNWAFAWLGIDLVALAVAHICGFHRLFGKRNDGTLTWWSWIAFLPLHLCTLTIWKLAVLLDPEPAAAVVSDSMVIGRRASEVFGDIQCENYVDLVAEMPETSKFRHRPGYRSFPILDASAPSPAELHSVISQLVPGRTFVHCAQGRGRTALFAVALLHYRGEISNVDEGLRILRTVRPGVRLNKVQRMCLEKYIETVQPNPG